MRETTNRIAGAVLVAAGILVLILGNISMGVAWPLFVIVPGIIMLGAAFLGEQRNAGLAVPGSIVTVVGLILLTFALTGHWQGWAYAWALIIAAAGFGTFLHGAIVRDAAREREGMRVVATGLTIFAIAGAIFELFIYGDFGATLRWLLPVALILAGGAMLLRRGGEAPPPPPPPPPSTEP